MDRTNFPSPRSWWEGIYAPIITIISFMIVTIIIVPFIPIRNCNSYAPESLRYCMRYLRSYDYRVLEAVVAIGLIIWIFSIAYLYQIEFLIRKNFSVQKFIKFLLIAIAGFSLVILSSFTIRNAPLMQELLQSAIKENSNKLSVVSPSPSATITASPPLQIDPFVQATENAIKASKLVQVAKTKLEWQEVAGYWENAITFMQVVPVSHPKYQIAQQKDKEYQSNLDYAKLGGSRAIN